jgi:acyl-CoA reductase-like NAD-dependent aldehyde dehydrogenase
MHTLARLWTGHLVSLALSMPLDLGLLPDGGGSAIKDDLNYIRDLSADWMQFLRPRREAIITDCAISSGVGQAGAEALWGDLERFVAGAERLGIDVDQRARLAYRQVAARKPGAGLSHLPWGRMLFAVPSNAPLPLGFIVPLALLAVGNNVVVAAPRRVRSVVMMLVEPLISYFGPDRLTLAENGVREALAAYVDTGAVEALYFTGSSDHFASLANRCAATGVELLYEGSGNGVAIVDDELRDDDLDTVSEQLVRALTFANGLMCTAPNVISIHDRHFDALCGRLVKAYGSQSPVVSVDRSFTSPSGGDASGLPGWLVPADDVITGQRRELFGPAAHVSRHRSWSALLGQLRRAPYRLQVTLYSRSDEKWLSLQNNTCFGRYCRNMTSTDQDPLLPWGNYGRSGSSPVRDFLDKGLRTVLIEEKTP